jgi:ABC-type branched-subunit amino acid transport system substrate-binding protein
VRNVRRKAAAALLIGALVTSACGSDRDDETSDPTTTAASADGATTTTAAPDVTFGDLESPCGPGDPTAASDQGVTADTIKIGYGDDAGYPQAPGLNHEMSDSIKALIDWCNEQGGINGRQVEGTYFDAKILEVNNVMLAACDQVFMLVGQGYSLDSAQEQTRVGCGLPSVPTYTVSPEFANGPLMYQPVPNPVDFQPVAVANYFSKTFPDKITKTAVMFGNFAATRDTKDKYLSTFANLGFEFLDCPQEYNISGEDDWKPFVQKLKDCGAEIVLFVGGPNPTFENFLVAADQLEYRPLYGLEGNFYDQQFSAWNTAGIADNSYVRMSTLPFEATDKVKALQDYRAIVEGAGGDISLLGMNAASAFLLWATAADACGDELTRQCVLDELTAIHEWNGGGLAGTSDPGANMPSECEVVMKLEGTKWVQVSPTTLGELECDPANVQPVTGEVVDKVQLGADRKVHLFE